MTEQKRLNTKWPTVGMCDVQCTILLCELYGRFQTFRNSLFSATSILLSDGEERDQRGEPYSERQYDFSR